jgi:hypothetical protein
VCFHWISRKIHLVSYHSLRNSSVLSYNHVCRIISLLFVLFRLKCLLNFRRFGRTMDRSLTAKFFIQQWGLHYVVADILQQVNDDGDTTDKSRTLSSKISPTLLLSLRAEVDGTTRTPKSVDSHIIYHMLHIIDNYSYLLEFTSASRIGFIFLNCYTRWQHYNPNKRLHYHYHYIDLNCSIFRGFRNGCQLRKLPLPILTKRLKVCAINENLGK